MTPVLTVTDAPSQAAQRVIGEGLRHYNEAQAGYGDSRALAVLIADDVTGEVLGGLLGRTSFGLCFIDLVFVPDRLRGHDLGRTIMRRAEEEARQRGCVSIMLYTISFQAPGFYEKLGYRRFGEVRCLPAGTSRIFFVKELA